MTKVTEFSKLSSVRFSTNDVRVVRPLGCVGEGGPRDRAFDGRKEISDARADAALPRRRDGGEPCLSVNGEVRI
jgi:hypothetical protein